MKQKPEQERERTGQGRVDGLEYGQNGGTKQGQLVRQRDGLMRLLAQREVMMKQKPISPNNDFLLANSNVSLFRTKTRFLWIMWHNSLLQAISHFSPF